MEWNEKGSDIKYHEPCWMGRTRNKMGLGTRCDKPVAMVN